MENFLRLQDENSFVDFSKSEDSIFVSINDGKQGTIASFPISKVSELVDFLKNSKLSEKEIKNLKEIKDYYNMVEGTYCTHEKG